MSEQATATSNIIIGSGFNQNKSKFDEQSLNSDELKFKAPSSVIPSQKVQQEESQSEDNQEDDQQFDIYDNLFDDDNVLLEREKKKHQLFDNDGESQENIQVYDEELSQDDDLNDELLSESDCKSKNLQNAQVEPTNLFSQNSDGDFPPCSEILEDQNNLEQNQESSGQNKLINKNPDRTDQEQNNQDLIQQPSQMLWYNSDQPQPFPMNPQSINLSNAMIVPLQQSFLLTNSGLIPI